MNSVAERAAELLTPAIEREGYEVVDIDYSKSYGENNLTVFIYKKGGVTLEDCERVNEAVDALLEANDLTNGAPYNLNVSSPGLDRPVVTEDDFRRSLGEELELIFRDHAKKKVNGILVSYDKNEVTLKVKGRDTNYSRNNIDTVRPYIKF